MWTNPNTDGFFSRQVKLREKRSKSRVLRNLIKKTYKKEEQEKKKH